MLACSLVHEGEENLALSRIQISRDIFGSFPEDVKMAVCRQCVKPQCVAACPTGACHVDTANGNVRLVDASKCTGEKKCVEACPFVPHMTMWNTQKQVAFKCDLCLNTPYWNEQGGPFGKQACVEVCPMNAIKFVKRGDKQKEASLKEEVQK
jgi:protein NrfC